MNYQSSNEALIGDKHMEVDTFEADCSETRSLVAVHYFNDGQGVAIGVNDPRQDGTASIVLSLEDSLVLFKWLEERLGSERHVRQ